MYKSKKVKKFSREKDQRKAFKKLLLVSFFKKGKIKTTEVRAKEIKRLADKFITDAKKGDLSARRKLLKYFSPKTTKKIIEEIAPLYLERKGGYTRVIKLGRRKSDGAKMAIVELVK